MRETDRTAVYRASLAVGGEFQVQADETLLAAALRAGLTLPYSCRTGRCGSCRAQVEQGRTEALHDEQGLSAAERADGWILTCVRRAASDLRLTAQILPGPALAPPRVLPCRIHGLERASDDVLIVRLRLPPGADFAYAAGQYIDVIGPASLRRSYSIANAPQPGGLLELHIRRVPGGAMSQYWFEQARDNDLLRLNGPLGTFVLQTPPPGKIVLLATGTGIAPIKAVLEALVQSCSRPALVGLFWGGRTEADLYWDPRCLGPWIDYTPVLSRAGAPWSGARGHVQDVAITRAAGTLPALVLAAGSPEMTRGARDAFLTAGLPATAFLSDAFVCSSSVD